MVNLHLLLHNLVSSTPMGIKYCSEVCLEYLESGIMVMLSTVFFSCYAFVRYLESGIQILRKCCQQLLNTAKKLMLSSTGCVFHWKHPTY